VALFVLLCLQVQLLLGPVLAYGGPDPSSEPAVLSHCPLHEGADQSAGGSPGAEHHPGCQHCGLLAPCCSALTCAPLALQAGLPGAAIAVPAGVANRYRFDPDRQHRPPIPAIS